jgi:ABC-2 type transport system permease protein
VGAAQGAIVLACAPLALPMTAELVVRGAGALVLAALASAALGLLVAVRLTSVENFGGVINVVLFPLLFVSGALYPTGGMPSALRALAQVNPVTYMVDLMRQALGQRGEFALATDVGALAISTVAAFVLTALLFDPEQRFVRGRPRPR